MSTIRYEVLELNDEDLHLVVVIYTCRLIAWWALGDLH
jgi:hypothetical protein